MYREYKGYIIKKNFVVDSYEIKNGSKKLHYGTAVQSFKRLRDAKEFIDKLENNEIQSAYYRWM